MILFCAPQTLTSLTRTPRSIATSLSSSRRRENSSLVAVTTRTGGCGYSGSTGLLVRATSPPWTHRGRRNVRQTSAVGPLNNNLGDVEIVLIWRCPVIRYSTLMFYYGAEPSILERCSLFREDLLDVSPYLSSTSLTLHYIHLHSTRAVAPESYCWGTISPPWEQI